MIHIHFAEFDLQGRNSQNLILNRLSYLSGKQLQEKNKITQFHSKSSERQSPRGNISIATMDDDDDTDNDNSPTSHLSLNSFSADKEEPIRDSLTEQCFSL